MSKKLLTTKAQKGKIKTTFLPGKMGMRDKAKAELISKLNKEKILREKAQAAAARMVKRMLERAERAEARVVKLEKDHADDRARLFNYQHGYAGALRGSQQRLDKINRLELRLAEAYDGIEILRKEKATLENDLEGARVTADIVRKKRNQYAARLEFFRKLPFLARLRYLVAPKAFFAKSKLYFTADNVATFTRLPE